MDIGNRIKELRNAKGLTQQSLARNIGISTSTIAMWEIGSREPNLESLDKLAQIFGITLGELVDPKSFHNDKKNEVVVYIPEECKVIKLSPEKRYFINQLSKIKESDLNVLLRIVDSLTKE